MWLPRSYLEEHMALFGRVSWLSERPRISRHKKMARPACQSAGVCSWGRLSSSHSSNIHGQLLVGTTAPAGAVTWSRTQHKNLRRATAADGCCNVGVLDHRLATILLELTYLSDMPPPSLMMTLVTRPAGAARLARLTKRGSLPWVAYTPVKVGCRRGKGDKELLLS